MFVIVSDAQELSMNSGWSCSFAGANDEDDDDDEGHTDNDYS